MVLSEAEAEAQLASLRRQRDALDRAIADLTLYLELGRRLTSGAVTAPSPDVAGAGPSSGGRRPDPAGPAGIGEPGIPAGFSVAGSSSRSEPVTSGANVGAASVEPVSPRTVAAASAAPAALRPEPAESVLSEGVLARRYGRALIEAAVNALERAGRPLHASEILAVLTQQGFALPGHDPVAALNTRLWKRSGPGGPLKRMGEAVYALAEAEQG